MTHKDGRSWHTTSRLQAKRKNDAKKEQGEKRTGRKKERKKKKKKKKRKKEKRKKKKEKKKNPRKSSKTVGPMSIFCQNTNLSLGIVRLLALCPSQSIVESALMFTLVTTKETVGRGALCAGG